MAVGTQPDLEALPLALPPHGRITRRQIFYLLVLQGIGATVIDAVANFSLACAMYRTTHKEIRLWPLDKNTIAGDMGVTVIIQGILTTLITSALVRGDVRMGRIQPFPFAWPETARWQRNSRWRAGIGRLLRLLSPTQTLSFRAGWHGFCASLYMILLRGFIISFLYFVIFWPLAIAITAPLYGGIDMHGSWTPEVIKAVFGGVLGLFMNPLIAALVLGIRGGRPKLTVFIPGARIASTTRIARPPFAAMAEPEMRTVSGPFRSRS